MSHYCMLQNHLCFSNLLSSSIGHTWAYFPLMHLILWLGYAPLANMFLVFWDFYMINLALFWLTGLCIKISVISLTICILLEKWNEQSTSLWQNILSCADVHTQNICWKNYILSSFFSFRQRCKAFEGRLLSHGSI